VPRRDDAPVRITPTFFFLLLTLVDGERHGYAMAQEVRDRSGGSIRLGPGSLYWSLNRLAEVGLIEEVAAPAAPVDGESGSSGRRRYYQLTDQGRSALQREATTLAKALDFARTKRLV
jgi:DNA-binding PadR family transcriptional regulator